jgi:hypothetical protein
MNPTGRLPIARQYNYFRVKAVENMLELLDIADPTPEQLELANRLVTNIAFYTRSQIGR